MGWRRRSSLESGVTPCLKDGVLSHGDQGGRGVNAPFKQHKNTLRGWKVSLVLGKRARKRKASMHGKPGGLCRTKSTVVCGTWQGSGRRMLLEMKSKSMCSAWQGKGPGRARGPEEEIASCCWGAQGGR